ncbi:hypothetical protein FZC76_03255 [Sutcliffiella horikoshii]|uniref:Uncharacterized protein n=1 Tax=Sutcliffiella horikoshii TaxID=79883 RepID=A0A5D4T6I7_9BACI|nr:sigma factor [Sutcliffiella horikoshii]TYS70925.1 hypothetical protein FZC76_03255 [Sutcliffiella horikoshii]
MDELAYVKKVRAGELQAFEPIIEKYKNSIYRLACWWTGSQELAERVTNDCFLKVYNLLSTYQEKELFSFWLYQEVLPLLKELPVLEDGETVGNFLSHNPHDIQLHEEVLSLRKECRVPLLLSYLLIELNDEQKAFLSENSLIDYNGFLLEAKIKIRHNSVTLSEKSTEACLEKEELMHYQVENLGSLEKNRMDDHLEFCPECRDLLQFLMREESMLQHVLQAPSLDGDFNVRVLKQLTPYTSKTPKQRTWAYQFGVIGVMIAVFVGGFVVLPTIIPWTKMVSNYLNYGSFYNVWAEGTYTATDNDITVEITAIEVDPLHMVVNYEVSSEDKAWGAGGVDRFTVHAVDEEGKTYPMEAASPKDSLMEMNRPFQESLPDSMFYVRALNEKALPEKFTLFIKYHLLNGWGGDWEIEVPIEYDKAMEEVEVLELNKILIVDEKIEVEVLTLEKGKYGSRLKYDVRLKEEEIKRIETNLKRTNQKYDQHYFMSYHDVFASVLLVNNEDKYLVPIGYPSFNNESAPFQLEFSNLYADRDFMELKGEADVGEKLSAEIRAIYYHEPGFYSLTVPLEETTKQPLNIDLDGYTMDELSVKRQEGGPTNVLLSGERTQHDKIRSFHWEFFDENGQSLSVYNTAEYGWYDRENMVSRIELINVDVDAEESQLLIQATQISNDYLFKEKEHRIPLD